MVMKLIIHTASAVSTGLIFTIRFIGTVGTTIPITIRFIILRGIRPPGPLVMDGGIAGTHHTIAGDGVIRHGTVPIMPGIMEGIMEATTVDTMVATHIMEM